MHAVSSQDYELNYERQQIQGQCGLLHVYSLRYNLFKGSCYLITSLLLFGIPFLLVYWWPNLERIFCYDFVPVAQCDHFLVVNHDEVCSIVSRAVEWLPTKETTKYQLTSCFINRHIKYMLANSTVTALVYDFKQRLSEIAKENTLRGFTEDQVQQSRAAFGSGAMHIQRPSGLVLFFRQIFRPLYVFTFVSLASWFIKNYTVFAIVICVTTITSILLSLYQLIQVYKRIYAMAYYSVTVAVLRDNKVATLSSEELTPGDIVFLKEAIKLPFEAVILEGDVLMNQCLLTGESVPVIKKSIELKEFINARPSPHKQAMLYDGTIIVQINARRPLRLFQRYRQTYGIAVCVTRTNFTTAKGQLIRTILYPKQQENEFQKHSMMFLAILFLFALLVETLAVLFAADKQSPSTIFYKAVELITITVAPSLPVSMTLGVVYAAEKLKDKLIFCTEPSKIISGGRVQCVCFDKTGTLTEDGMNFKLLLSAHQAIFHQEISAQEDLARHLSVKSLLPALGNMGGNHSLTQIVATGQIVGDPMELELFQFGKFKLEEVSQQNNDAIVSFSSRMFSGSVLHRFEFDSNLQCMSVIACSQGLRSVYTKGSPEALLKILDSKTVPSDYAERLNRYASEGLRVLAIASKQISEDDEITRDQCEKQLKFNGFEVFENSLKAATKPAILSLHQAAIQSIMITGDNPLTAVSIGYESGILPETGSTIIIDEKDGQLCSQWFGHGSRQRNININSASGTIDSPSARVDATSVNIDSAFVKGVLELLQFQEDGLCITGLAFNRLFLHQNSLKHEQKQQLTLRTKIYARAKPFDKAEIVKTYQSMGRIVAMCGDGANDCAALKQSHVGLSLSQAEASISAPFTSQVCDISSMVSLLKQCRCGLATNFSLFNIAVLYSLIQFTSTVLTECFYTQPTDGQFLYWDMCCNFIFVATIGYTQTADTLTKDCPRNSLCSISNLLQIFIIALFQAAGQVLVLGLIQGPLASDIDYYQTGGLAHNFSAYAESGDTLAMDTPEAAALFLFSNHMYIFTLLAFFISQPWRKDFWTNTPFMCMLVIVFGYNVLLCVLPQSRVGYLYLGTITSEKVAWLILQLALAIGLFIYTVQKYILEHIMLYLTRT